jgi:hypothetical protein
MFEPACVQARFEPAQCLERQNESSERALCERRKSRIPEPNANQAFMAKGTTTTEHGSAKVATEGDVNASTRQSLRTPRCFFGRTRMECLFFDD